MKPDRARFLRSSHPIPPAPTRRMGGAAMRCKREGPRVRRIPERRGWDVGAGLVVEMVEAVMVSELGEE